MLARVFTNGFDIANFGLKASGCTFMDGFEQAGMHVKHAGRKCIGGGPER